MKYCAIHDAGHLLITDCGRLESEACPMNTGFRANHPYHSSGGAGRKNPAGLQTRLRCGDTAIGDLALTNALESIAAARQDYPGGHRDRVEHVQLYRPQDLSLFHELEVAASVQPVFLGTDLAPADKRWGPERCRYAYARKSLLQANLRVQFGSDAPVESINLIFGIHAAVTRQDAGGQPAGGWYPDQVLSLEDAITGYTMLAAWNTRREDQLGFIAPGKWADLTVFEKDLFHLAPKKWLSVKTVMTVVHGEVVYRA